MRDLVGHGGTDEVILVMAGDVEVEAQHGAAANVPDALAGALAFQVVADHRFRQSSTMAAGDGFAIAQAGCDGRRDAFA